MNHEDIEKGLMACVHCGFCLQACPTYRETGDEADSPRGRLVLMRRVFEGELAMAGNAPGEAGYHLDRCLGCRACETACPSGVPYGALLEEFRDQQEQTARRPLGERALRDGLLGTLTNPKRMALALRAGKLTGGRVPGPVAKFLGLPADTALPLPPNLEAASKPLPERTPADPDQETRARVALLLGCVMRVMYAPVHWATVRVLAANGVEVFCPKEPTCCGALHGHQGQLAGARRRAQDTIAALEQGGYDALIVNSAGCGSFLKEYGHLLKDDPAWAERAAAIAAQTKDVCEYLHALGPRPMDAPVNARVTYHDACHLAHGQKVTNAPRALLKAIPGVTFVEMGEADQCCGSAGVYNFLQPEMARALQKKKVDNLLATRADIVATGNPGCLAWIQTGLPKDAKTPEIVHPIQLLDRAYHVHTS